MRVYLDVCCLNRPFDDQSQDRIRLESEAIILIMKRFEASEDWQWVSSQAVDIEIAQTPDRERRHRIQLLAKHVHEHIHVDASEIHRAQVLNTLGFHFLDALHVACAERASADIFLTTDDQLLRSANRVSNQLYIQVANPLNWLAKVAQT